jgi:hypothetical protein
MNREPICATTFVASFHYAVPALKSKCMLHAAEEGWAAAGIARLTSGLPVTLFNNNDTSLLGTIPNGINNGVDTPEWSGASLSLNTNPRNGRAVFDASQLTLPALGTMGNARRRFFSGPGMENLDATVSRNFKIHEDHAIEFRVEAFNVFNHAQFFGASAVEQHLEWKLWSGGERDAAAFNAARLALQLLALGKTTSACAMHLSRQLWMPVLAPSLGQKDGKARTPAGQFLQGLSSRATMASAS